MRWTNAFWTRKPARRPTQSALSVESLEARDVPSVTPYVVPSNPAVSTVAIISAGETAVNGYRMAGTPDGLGAFDNGDGTFTVLMNHEFSTSQAVGVARAHNAALLTDGNAATNPAGSFVSEWVIRKDTLEVVSGRDLIETVVLTSGGSLNFDRFCSADLAPVSAFAFGGLGTADRIYLNGEETANGRAFAHVVTGDYAHTSFELARLGRVAFENAVANPFAQALTVVAATDDTTPSATNTGGRVYVYVGTKTAAGTPVDRAGLTNGTTYAVQVGSLLAEDRNSPAAGRFSLVSPTTTPSSTGGTQFLRPEDVSWDPSRPNVLYFATTDRYDQVKDGVGTTVARSRLYRLTFDDVTNPTAGGTIEAVLDGTEAGNMYDNIAVDAHGRVILLEDVGNQAHNGKVWMYEAATDRLVQVARHDPARFGDVGQPATAPYNQDEESSGVIDVSDIFGPGTYLIDDQAHYPITTPAGVVEGGQLLLMRVPVAPTVAAVQVNDGSAQRSKVSAVTVTFDAVVPAANIGAGAFTLTRAEGGAYTATVASVTVVGGQTLVTLAFAGPGVGADGALPDGTYSLSVDAGKVTDQLGQALDTDRDGVAGGPVTEVVAFRTLFGDLNGDGRVDGQEVAASAHANGARRGEAGYLWYLDFDGDGVINGKDHREVARRNGNR
ncbi:MAG: hypothetical protein U0804_10990 [Gemmataceae bacterium]